MIGDYDCKLFIMSLILKTVKTPKCYINNVFQLCFLYRTDTHVYIDIDPEVTWYMKQNCINATT